MKPSKIAKIVTHTAISLIMVYGLVLGQIHFWSDKNVCFLGLIGFVSLFFVCIAVAFGLGAIIDFLHKKLLELFNRADKEWEESYNREQNYKNNVK